MRTHLAANESEKGLSKTGNLSKTGVACGLTFYLITYSYWINVFGYIQRMFANLTLLVPATTATKSFPVLINEVAQLPSSNFINFLPVSPNKYRLSLVQHILDMFCMTEPRLRYRNPLDVERRTTLPEQLFCPLRRRCRPRQRKHARVALKSHRLVDGKN